MSVPLPRRALTLFQVLVMIVLTQMAGDAAPPFSGTIFLDPDIITAADPTALSGISFTGTARRQVYDRRLNTWITIDMHLATATYVDDRTIEVQVNPEFGQPEAIMAPAEKYARLVGQLPAILRSNIRSITIHQGVQPFGGGNNNILIHVGQSASYEAQGILEETLVHEATHTSLDPDHEAAPAWVAAQRADPEFISTYARDFPGQEDLAESYLLHLAFRHRRDRITATLATTIERTMPNRMAYFDQQHFNLFPFLTAPASITALTASHAVEAGRTTSLNVVANGSVPMSYQWYLGESPDVSTPFPGATASSFTTPELSRTAPFWVRVSNPYGPPADSSTILVTVR